MAAHRRRLSARPRHPGVDHRCWRPHRRPGNHVPPRHPARRRLLLLGRSGIGIGSGRLHLGVITERTTICREYPASGAFSRNGFIGRIGGRSGHRLEAQALGHHQALDQLERALGEERQEGGGDGALQDQRGVVEADAGQDGLAVAAGGVRARFSECDFPRKSTLTPISSISSPISSLCRPPPARRCKHH